MGNENGRRPDSTLDHALETPAAVYEIVKVLGPHKLRIKPEAKADGQSAYSIGRRCYGKFTVSNCDFFLLDTRSHRTLHNVDNPGNPQASMIGKRQLAWLKEGIRTSKSDFIFVVSSVNFMVPHVGSGGGDDKQAAIKKDDTWTVFLKEREELIEFWDDLDKAVSYLPATSTTVLRSRSRTASGNSPVARTTPLTTPHKDEEEGPQMGNSNTGPAPATSDGRAYAMADIPQASEPSPTTVVQVNTSSATPWSDGERWFAFPHPQVIFHFHDALTGDFATRRPSCWASASASQATAKARQGVPASHIAWLGPSLAAALASSPSAIERTHELDARSALMEPSSPTAHMHPLMRRRR